MVEFSVKCMGENIPLDLYVGNIEREKVIVDCERFSNLCKIGCRNYGQKYCCPPKATPFHKIHPDMKWLQVIYMRCALANVPSKNAYHKIRVANAIMKARLEKFLRDMKDDGEFVLGSGACRACKDCGLRLGIPCKKPSRMMMSLEATGVNCQELVKSLFNVDLEWYRPKAECRFTAVVGGILISEMLFPEDIITRIAQR